MKTCLAGAACALALMSAAPVSAASIDAAALIQSFNVITLGDFNNQVHVHGRTFVGGDYNASQFSELNKDQFADIDLGGISGTTFIAGDVNGSGLRSFKGSVQIGGAANATVDAQNGAKFTGVAGIPVSDVAAAMQSYSLFLRDLGLAAGTTGVIAGDSNNPVFSAGATVEPIEYFNLSASDFTNQNSNFSANTGVLTIVNVSGATVNFAGKVSNPLPNVIFNFFEATSLTFNQTFSANIIAPNAVVNALSNFTGTIVANSLSLRNGEIHPLVLTGLPTQPVANVPLPASALLLLGGVGLFGGMRLRRRAA